MSNTQLVNLDRPFVIAAIAYAEGTGFVNEVVGEAIVVESEMMCTLSEQLQITNPPNPPPVYEASLQPQTFIRTVHVYENERYSPRLGFSSKSLLVLDRGAFSSNDGKMWFSSLDEVNMQLISPGWSWIGDDWEVQLASRRSNTPPQSQPLQQARSNNFGWYYNTDFSFYTAVNIGVENKGITHFVRRRRLTRQQQFDEYAVQGEVSGRSAATCTHCDLNAVRKLQTLLFEKILLALQLNGKYRGVNIRNIQTLKTDLIGTILNDPDTRALRVYLFDQCETVCCRFIETITGGLLNVKRIYQNVPVVTHSAEDRSSLNELFPLEEQIGLSRAIIRALDLQHRYHCGAMNCGSRCEFAVHRCPNPTCTELFSRSAWQQHDDVCPFKIIACPLQCGELVVRRDSAEHMINSCVMRVVACPYQSIGCNPTGLLFCQVSEHCRLNIASHLSFAMNHIEILKGENNYLRSSVTTLEVQLAQHRAEQHRHLRGRHATVAPI